MGGSILGNRVLRKEDPKFLTDGGTYMDDLRDEPALRGAAWVHYVRSTMAHATLGAITPGAAAAADTSIAPSVAWAMVDRT